MGWQGADGINFNHEWRGRVRGALIGAATVAVGLAGPAAVADAHFVRSSYAFNAGGCTVEQRTDPVTIVFYGGLGDAENVRAAVRTATGWVWATGNRQWLASHERCYGFNSQLASAVTLTRFHIRFWQMPDVDLRGRYITYGTPHHEDFVFGQGCGLIGNHAVDETGPPAAASTGAAARRRRRWPRMVRLAMSRTGRTGRRSGSATAVMPAATAP